MNIRRLHTSRVWESHETHETREVYQKNILYDLNTTLQSVLPQLASRYNVELPQETCDSICLWSIRITRIIFKCIDFIHYVENCGHAFWRRYETCITIFAIIGYFFCLLVVIPHATHLVMNYVINCYEFYTN